MNRLMTSIWDAFFVVFCICFLVGIVPDKVDAALSAMDSQIIADSEEDFSRRIYSYDMAVDSKGDVHIIYSKPLGDRTAQIIYVRRSGGDWKQPAILSSSGFRASVSTFLIVGNDDTIHVSYIKDINGTSESLYYRKIENGNLTPEVFVDAGGWHTRMQLDAQGYPVFVRDNATWPEEVSKLALLTTQNGTDWTKSYLDLPYATAFKVADFLVENGVYYITYGDSAYIKPVLTGKGSTTYRDGVFHNLHYVTSLNGQSWTHREIDSSGTMYELEFWPALVLDNGRPVISMYKYAEYGNQYNTGTSALMANWNGIDWQNKIITDTSYPDSREGMGVGLVVNGAGDYFGVWDYSPDDTHNDDFRGERGNIALVRSGSANDWSQKFQIAPFSLEGAAKLRIDGGKLFFLGLGDYIDAKLYFYEYNISTLGGGTPSSSTGTTLPAAYLLLK